MTEKVYYNDQYLKELDAKVVKVLPNKVLLDRTIFFPQTNTEPGDFGKISNYKISGLKKENDDIWHIFQKSVEIKENDIVKLEIDWNKRYKAMRLHSTLHMVASIFDSLFSERAVAGAVKADLTNAYIVFKHQLSDEKLPMVIKEAQKIIENGVEIITMWDDKREGFRWCQIGDYSPIPCGGLHVKNTKEIQQIKSFKQELDGQREKIIIEIL